MPFILVAKLAATAFPPGLLAVTPSGILGYSPKPALNGGIFVACKHVRRTKTRLAFVSHCKRAEVVFHDGAGSLHSLVRLRVKRRRHSRSHCDRVVVCCKKSPVKRGSWSDTMQPKRRVGEDLSEPFHRQRPPNRLASLAHPQSNSYLASRARQFGDKLTNLIRSRFFCFDSFIYNPLHAARGAMVAAGFSKFNLFLP